MIQKTWVQATTDAGGNLVIAWKDIGVPIALITDTSHYIYSFFWADAYWYARLSSAYHSTYFPIANTEITGTLYYISYK